MRQWLCDCGQWVNVAYLRHPHIERRAATVQEMIEARKVGIDLTELGMTGNITHGMWTPEREHRDAPPTTTE